MYQSRPFDYLYDPIYELSDKKNQPTLPLDIFFKDFPQEILEQFKCFPKKPKELPFQRMRGGGNMISYGKYQKMYCAKGTNACNSPKFDGFPEIVDIVFPEKPCKYKVPKPSPRKKWKAVQTALRKDQTQTEMYSPPVLETGSAKLEVNTVAAFIQPNDCIGMFEIRTIERARRRLEYENCLMKVMSAKDSAKALVLLEAFEWEEWIAREEDIANCQNLRMEIMLEMFFEREEKNRSNQETRFKLGVKKISKEANEAFQKRQIQYLRDKRRLDDKFSGLRQYKHLSTLEHFTNKASEFYSPLVRHGRNPRYSHFAPRVPKFDERMAALDVNINFKDVVCKFHKFNEFSIPKSKTQKKVLLSEKVLHELQYSCKVGFRLRF